MPRIILYNIFLLLLIGCRNNNSSNKSYLIDKSNPIFRIYEDDSVFATLSNTHTATDQGIQLSELTCYRISDSMPELVFKDSSVVFHVNAIHNNYIVYLADNSLKKVLYLFKEKHKITLKSNISNGLNDSLYYGWNNSDFTVLDKNDSIYWHSNGFQLLKLIPRQNKVVGSKEGRIQIRNIFSGKTIWEIDIKNKLKDIQVYSDKLLISTFKKIYCYDIATGKILWNMDFPTSSSEILKWSNISSPNNKAYFLHPKLRTPSLKCINLLTGELTNLYESNKLRTSDNSLRMDRDGKVYFIDNNKIYCFLDGYFNQKKQALGKLDLKNSFLTNQGIVYQLNNGESYFRHY